LLPQSKSSGESVGIVSGSAVWGQLFQFFGIASSQNYIVGFKGGGQARDHIRDIAPPLFLAAFFECLAAHIAFVGSLLIRKVAQFHWFHDAIHNQSRTEASTQTQEEHFPAFVAPQSLHGRIINHLDWTLECGFKIKPDPPGSQVMRFGHRSVLDYWAGIAHRDCVILPLRSQPLDPGHHLLRRHRSAGRKLPWRSLPSGKDLHVSSTDINHQHVHERAS